ncbi:MAG: ATP-binding protein, partial [Anaerolineales bacterium]
AERMAFEQKTARIHLMWMGSFLFVGILAADYVWNESDWALECRIRRHARKGIFVEPSSELCSRKLPATMPDVPLMIVGPTGCGKTTLMSLMVNKHLAMENPQSKRYGLVLSSRATNAWQLTVNLSDSENTDRLSDPRIVLLDAYRTMLHSGGLSFERPWVVRLFRGLRESFSGTEFPQAKVEMSNSEQLESDLGYLQHRCWRMLMTIFRCAEKDTFRQWKRSQANRSESETSFDVPWLVCFDELQDLVRSDRVAQYGGAGLLHRLATQLVVHTCDRKVLRVVVADSSSALSNTFHRTVANIQRWRYYNLVDLQPAWVDAALKGAGYTANEREIIVKTYGYRARDLSKLMAGISDPSVADYIDSDVAARKIRIRSQFARESEDNQAVL